MKSLVQQWQERCELIRFEEEGPRVVEVSKSGTQDVVGMKLYDILKRSTNGDVNKVVAIGFTLVEAEKWLERKVSKAKEKDDTVIFYDIVDQENKEALNPLWNPRPFFIEEAA